MTVVILVTVITLVILMTVVTLVAGDDFDDSGEIGDW